MNSSDFINEIYDQNEYNIPSYSVELVDTYFTCSHEYWDSLSDEEREELIGLYPHLASSFD